jgi:transcriptional regulator with XRE-family HTH domain
LTSDPRLPTWEIKRPGQASRNYGPLLETYDSGSCRMRGSIAGQREQPIPPKPYPSIARRRLALELRRLREAQGLTIEHVAKAVGLSVSTISRIENAQVRVRRGEVREILDVLNVSQEEQDRLLELAVEALQKAWWYRSYRDLTIPYADFEAAASTNLLYQPLVVPGLLQTEAYARNVFQALRIGLEPPNVERWVAFRMEREKRFMKEGRPAFHAVLDEAVLRRPIGGPAVMRKQLARLVELSERPNVKLQVLTFEAGAHAGLDGAFLIYEFDAYPDIVYLESTGSDLWLEEADEVKRYKQVFASLSGQALTVQESRAFLSRIAANTP